MKPIYLVSLKSQFYFSMSALAVSQIEKHFITNEIYKRSKRYFDVIRLKSIENQDSKFRRMPSSVQREELQKKIQNSFMSSEEYFNKKRLQQIEKVKKKHCSFDVLEDTDETETNYSVVTKNNSSVNKKGFDMSKSLSRQFYQNLQNNTYTSIEDPFDSFVSSDFSKGEKGKSIDFNKVLGRKDHLEKQKAASKNISTQSQLNPEHHQSVNLSNRQRGKTEDTTKVYEKFYFDQSRFKCLIDVEKQRKAQHRKSLKTTLKEYEPKQISLERIEKGRAFSQKHPIPSSLMFYYGKGKQQPSQMHIRTLKKNENYWVQQLKIMKKQDFQTVKRREEMIEKRIRQINLRKEVIDERGQICDSKFFLRNRHK